VEPDVLHGATALEESVILDIFTPQREDFLGSVKVGEEEI